LFERTLGPSWDERSHRGFTTLVSFGLQALVVSLLIVLPMLRPQGLPLFPQLSSPVSLGQPLTEPQDARPHTAMAASAPNAPVQIFLRQPSRIPSSLPTAGNDASSQIGSGPYLPGAPNGSGTTGVLNSFGYAVRPIMPAAPAPVTHLVRLSRSARIQDTVVLQAMISKQGTIENLRLLSGHPMLAPAAIDAVRQWRYRPYILNNEPVEVETQITVNFFLGEN
jgi:periplasmic protein TonB